ncbi:MAG: hypothetical protein ABL952_03345 [Pyrinomonadaceae bacterium]
MLLFTNFAMAKGWNNIIPLQTTRAEVIKLLGEPKAFQGNGPEYFAFNGDKVFFQWARGSCYKIGRLVIDESLVTQDSVVYEFKVEPHSSNQPKYEAEVKEFLASLNKMDCVGPNKGACGSWSFDIGFGYSRSDRGINRVSYHATPTESNDWFLTLKPCSVEKITSSKT